MRTSRIPFIVVAFLIGAAVASAYVLNGPKWGVKQIPYYINPANADLSESAAIAGIQAGAMTWSAQSNADVSLYYMGKTTGSSLQRNGKNEMFFRSTSAGSMAAETYWWYDSSYKLVEADIVFYDGGFRFFSGTSGCSSGVYLEDIATHEFGHAIGLGHSNVSTASMYPSIKYCTTAVRSLDPDDLAGVEKLYPPTSSNSAPSVSIISPTNNSSVKEGASVSFSGSASDKEDGNLSAKLVWTSNRDGQIGTGSSFSRVLTTGTHTITAKTSDSAGYSSSSQVSIAVESTTTNTAPKVTISAPANNTNVAYGTTLTFSGSASDAEDGSLTSKLVWKSNLDGTFGMGGSVSKALSAGTHTVRATVTDSGGVTSYQLITVNVIAPTSPPPTGLSLSANGYKKRGVQYANLKWSGATSTKVDIYRDGIKVANTANDGAHTDNINKKGGGSYTYKLCEVDTTICSSSVLVRF